MKANSGGKVWLIQEKLMNMQTGGKESKFPWTTLLCLNHDALQQVIVETLEDVCHLCMCARAEILYQIA